MVAPIIEELANEYDGKVTVGKCDVEEADDIAAEFGIRNIPTIVFMKDGKILDKIVGAAVKKQMRQKAYAASLLCIFGIGGGNLIICFLIGLLPGKTLPDVTGGERLKPACISRCTG